MLKSVVIKDFFSFRGNTKISLSHGQNLLLGINGSGKTSFINALRLLTEGICGSGVENLIQTQWGGYSQILNCTGREKSDNIQITYVFDCDEINKFNKSKIFHSDVFYQVTINPLGTTDYFLEEKLWIEQCLNTENEFVYFDFHNGQGHIRKITRDESVIFQDYSNGDISGRELVLKQINDPIQFLPIHTVKKAVESMSVYNSFDTGETSKIRRVAEYSTGTRLWKNGENLTQLLNDLRNNHSLDFEKIEEELHKVNSSYKNIEINNITGQAYLSLREKNLNKTIGALHISDGTLRFLLLETVFLNPNRGAFIAIDEPERGLHPDMIRSVAEMIKSAAQNSQLIIATHSPHLLNQFDLDDVIVFEKDESNSTLIKKLSDSDFSDYDGQLLPGQIWLNGEIGGKRW